MSWQQHDGCHFPSFRMLVSGAKFEEHCFNISRDIRGWVLYCFSGTTYDIITFLICIIQKRKYLHNEKDIPKWKTPFFFTLKSLTLQKIRCLVRSCKLAPSKPRRFPSFILVLLIKGSTNVIIFYDYFSILAYSVKFDFIASYVL